jgi:hypothetical protein
MLAQSPLEFKKNSILGSQTSAHGPDDEALKTPVEPHQVSARRQPKRKATTMKNSKYDESSYLVEYSGKNKVRRIEDSALQISSDTHQSGGGYARKRSAKQHKKRVTESNVFD